MKSSSSRHKPHKPTVGYHPSVRSDHSVFLAVFTYDTRYYMPITNHTESKHQARIKKRSMGSKDPASRDVGTFT